MNKLNKEDDTDGYYGEDDMGEDEIDISFID